MQEKYTSCTITIDEETESGKQLSEIFEVDMEKGLHLSFERRDDVLPGEVYPQEVQLKFWRKVTKE
jgi:hypothetical protein